MSRSVEDRISDMVDAIDRCLTYQPYLVTATPLIEGMARDAILRNLTVIGEIVRVLPSYLIDNASDTPWTAIGGLRNIVVHEYFHVDQELIAEVVKQKLSPLAISVLQAAWTNYPFNDDSVPSARTPRNYVYSHLLERWYWTDGTDYLSWLEETLRPMVAIRERARLLAQLENDLEALVTTRWSVAYGPSSFRDPDSDYHYFNQAPLDLGWSKRYGGLWDLYLAIWKEYNEFGRRGEEWPPER